MTTAIRAALLANSGLIGLVKDGAQALERGHRELVAETARHPSRTASTSTRLCTKHEQNNRWDYLLGHQPSGSIIGLEPHTANNHEISVVIKKRKAALGQLRGHLKAGKFVAAWFWVASGKVDFAPTEKA